MFVVQIMAVRSVFLHDWTMNALHFIHKFRARTAGSFVGITGASRKS